MNSVVKKKTPTKKPTNHDQKRNHPENHPEEHPEEQTTENDREGNDSEEQREEHTTPTPNNYDDIFIVEPNDGGSEQDTDTPMTPIEVDEILGGNTEESAEEQPAEDDPQKIVVKVIHTDPKRLDEEDIVNSPYDPTLDIAHYKMPMPQLLTDYREVNPLDEEEIFRNKERIRETLLHFHIPIISMTATVGPTVTLYEIVQEPGVKICNNTLCQVVRYNSILKCQYIVITNGINTFCYHNDEGNYTPITRFPTL